MNSLQIFTLFVGFLSIAMCLLYARTKKFNGRNNLPSITLRGIISMIITILGTIYPSWWMLCIACYELMILYIWAELSEPNNARRSYRNKRWYRSKSYQFTIDVLGWATFITELIVSIIMIVSQHWLFIPTLIISITVIGIELKTWLKKFWFIATPTSF